MTPNNILLRPISHCLAQSVSEKLLQNEYKYKDPHVDNVQRVRDFGTISSKWGILFKTLLSGLRKLDRKGITQIVNVRGDG